MYSGTPVTPKKKKKKDKLCQEVQEKLISISKIYLMQ